MILLTIDEIITLHQKAIKKTGGLDGIRDMGLLESAVYSINAAFEDIEQYPSCEEKSARLAFSLINNHAFVDGNKRVGVLAMLITLKINEIVICYTQKELISLGLGVADGSINYEEILQWILSHKK